MILTEKRFLENGIQYLVLEVETKGSTYYRILRCPKMKKCTPKLMRLDFKRNRNHYTRKRKSFEKARLIQIIACTKKGGYHVLA
jgi:glutamine amidotransferase PdxT